MPENKKKEKEILEEEMFDDEMLDDVEPEEINVVIRVFKYTDREFFEREKEKIIEKSKRSNSEEDSLKKQEK